MPKQHPHEGGKWLQHKLSLFVGTFLLHHNYPPTWKNNETPAYMNELDANSEEELHSTVNKSALSWISVAGNSLISTGKDFNFASCDSDFWDENFLFLKVSFLSDLRRQASRWELMDLSKTISSQTGHEAKNKN